ncbi:MAG: ABC transporter ATP-binding protein [Gemmataceae bacterium]|nr:ABC transporter ATP-binding protein [Gemmataceae bacterium]MDW8267450.1 ABC transporter ATP-binding protein [Gemmataceae bacterium]
MPASEWLLEAAELTKDYGSFRALDRLNLTIAPGEIVGLLGPNGSGKSTALRLMLGFLRPTRGWVAIGGHDCWRDGVAARQQVAYLPGELRLYENMTGRQILRFLGQLRQTDPSPVADTLAKRWDIDLSRPLVELSSGMKRKVALLSVLAAPVPLLILDEPTNTLDPTMRHELLEQLGHARDRGQAVLFSSHVLAEVEQVCDRVAILCRGKLVHEQALRELRRTSLVRVVLARPVAEVPPLPGLHVHRREGGHLVLETSGPLPPLLEWLARQPVEELRVEPTGLGPIYRRIHGADAE